jgi:hypothetical protein
MSLVRNVWNDLVEKRLWPVAIVLVIALVAVPVLITRGQSTSTSAGVVATAAPAGPVAGTAVVSLAPSATGPTNRPGKVRNPFTQAAGPAAPSTVASTAPASSPSGSGSTPSSGGGGTPTTPTTTAPTTTTPVKKKSARPDVLDTYRVSLRFGQAGAQHVIHNVARLAPLPSARAPFFVFLGVLQDGKTAVFLVSSDAAATGDGKCRPSATDCETIEMKAGDTEFFDLSLGSAGVLQYQLDVLHVQRRKTDTKAVAARAHKREAHAGRSSLRAVIAAGELGVSRYVYSSKLGVLKRVRQLKAGASAHIPAAVGGSSTAAQPSGDAGAGPRWVTTVH